MAMRKSSKWYNEFSKAEDADLYETMGNVLEYAQRTFKLPEGYIFERWDRVPYDLMQMWLLKNGYPLRETTYLMVPNPNGGYASISPDGGLIVAVKKDCGGNVTDWYPLLASEAKHQESSEGNAIERVFKNYNALQNLYRTDEVFPYLCFAQGKGFDSPFIQNKIRVAIGNDVNRDVNIFNKKICTGHGRFISKPVGNMFIRKNRWTKEEMYGRLVSAMNQSYEYFFEKR